MGLLDKLKQLVSGNKDKVKDGIDKAADVIDDKVPEQHRDKVDQAADAAKDAVEKLPD